VLFYFQSKPTLCHAENGRKENPMLSRKLNTLHNLYLYAEDATDSATTDTQQDKTGQGTDGKTFTQDDLDKHIASAKKAGKSSALKDYFAELGLDDTGLKALIAKSKADDDAKKTEAEKLTELLAQKDKEIAEAKAEAQKAESLRRIEKRNAGIRALIADAHDADSVLVILETKFQAPIEALMNEAGEFDAKEAEKLIAEFRTKNAYLFKGQGKGSPSNSDGRLLKPEAEIKKELEAEIRKKIRF
jgi:hypothetical protein